METWDAIRARRNVRAYRPDPVTAEDLDRITEAGRRAPSASNRQHWDFVVVTDPDQLRALSGVWRGAGHVAGAAAAIALVLPTAEDDRTRLLDYYDLGQATYAMAVAAADLGIGTAHSSVGDQDAARKILGVPGDHEVTFLLGVGYPADRPLSLIRRPSRRSRRPWTRSRPSSPTRPGSTCVPRSCPRTWAPPAPTGSSRWCSPCRSGSPPCGARTASGRPP